MTNGGGARSPALRLATKVAALRVNLFHPGRSETTYPTANGGRLRNLEFSLSAVALATSRRPGDARLQIRLPARGSPGGGPVARTFEAVVSVHCDVGRQSRTPVALARRKEATLIWWFEGQSGAGCLEALHTLAILLSLSARTSTAETQRRIIEDVRVLSTDIRTKGL